MRMGMKPARGGMARQQERLLSKSQIWEFTGSWHTRCSPSQSGWRLSFDALRESYCRLAARSGPTLCNPMDCSPPSSSVYEISQAGILEGVTISFSRGSSWPRDWTWVSCIAGRFFTIWATRDVLTYVWVLQGRKNGWGRGNIWLDNGWESSRKTSVHRFEVVIPKSDKHKEISSNIA